MGAGLASVLAPVARGWQLISSLPIVSRELASRLAGSWVSILMFRRPITCLLHEIFALGTRAQSDGRDVVPLPRRVADELVLASALVPLCFTDIAVPYSNRIYATDASLNWGAVTSLPIEPELGKFLWLGGDRKGGYTRLDHKSRAMLRALGEEAENHCDDHLLNASQRTIEFVFDFVEICGGSGVVPKKVAVLGLSVCTPIDLSRSPHFELTNLDLLWWILGLVRPSARHNILLLGPMNSHLDLTGLMKKFFWEHFDFSIFSHLLDFFPISQAIIARAEQIVQDGHGLQLGNFCLALVLRKQSLPIACLAVHIERSSLFDSAP